MCSCSSAHLPEFNRRNLLAGFGALASVGVARRALAASACFDAATLAGKPGERLRRRPSAADKAAEPLPAAPGTPVVGSLAGAIRSVELPAGSKLIALTFDLCQTRGTIAGYDGAIVDYLRANAVPATFFAGGLWLGTHRERANQLVSDPLFAVGNHSWTHHDLHFAAADKVGKEILLTEAALAEARSTAGVACGRLIAAPAHRLFRFPYGSCSPAALSAANGVGAVVIQWDVVSGDPDGTSASQISRRVLSETHPGAIVVMHANGRGTHTAEALATIVPKLLADGYRFVTVDRLLAAGKPVAATSCFIEKIGDTARYDAGKPKVAARPLLRLFKKVATKRG